MKRVYCVVLVKEIYTQTISEMPQRSNRVAQLSPGVITVRVKGGMAQREVIGTSEYCGHLKVLIVAMP